jgi:NAD(P)-dependent dehydrogenase (short-subunit alcohol dehydrogenase family)
MDAKDVVRQIQSAGTEAIAVRADLTKASQVKRLKERVIDAFGRADVLINNAAIFFSTPLETVTEREWDSLIDTNLKSVFLCCTQFAPIMKRQGAGKIVNIADVSATRPWAKYVPYCVSKAAVIALTQGLAKELAPRIQVNAVAPGVVIWPRHSTGVERRRRLQQIPLRRIGTPEDVARTVLFLLDSDYITGAVIPVDGGRSLT